MAAERPIFICKDDWSGKLDGRACILDRPIIDDGGSSLVSMLSTLFQDLKIAFYIDSLNDYREHTLVSGEIFGMLFQSTGELRRMTC